MDNPQQKITVSIWRGKEDGALESFETPLIENQTILDLLTNIQRKVDSSLSYRFACRVGMCGSCAMRVNGKPRWTCRTLVSNVVTDGELRLEPLANLPVVKDLVVDMVPFFEKWQAAKGRFEPKDAGVQEFAPIRPDDKKRQKADAAIECINCAVCYSACDVVESNPAFLGPAALNRAWSLMNDERDGSSLERLTAVSGEGGCQSCHTNSQCVARCPLQLNPTASIAGLKKQVALAMLKGAI